MSYSLASSRFFICRGRMPERILNLVEKQGGLSSAGAWPLGKKNSVQVALCMLYRRGYLKRFDFQTAEGKIYYARESGGWEYGLRKGLIPASTKLLFSRIRLNGAVSTLELRDLGVTTQDIYWFTEQLAKAHKVRASNLGGHWVFYTDEARLAEYEKKHLPSLPALQSKVNTDAERRGVALEEMLARYYESQGFSVEKNRFFKDSMGHTFEVDLLAMRPELGLTIAVEAKNYERAILGPAICTKVSRIRDVMPRAIIHLYAKNISYHLIHSPFWKQNPSVWLFTGKRIAQIAGAMSRIPIKAM